MPGLIVLLSRSYGGGFLASGLFAQRSRAWLVPPPSGGIDSRHPLAARALRSGLGTAQQAQPFRAQRIVAEDQPLAPEREAVLGTRPRPRKRARAPPQPATHVPVLSRGKN